MFSFHYFLRKLSTWNIKLLLIIDWMTPANVAAVVIIASLKQMSHVYSGCVPILLKVTIWFKINISFLTVIWIGFTNQLPLHGFSLAKISCSHSYLYCLEACYYLESHFAFQWMKIVHSTIMTTLIALICDFLSLNFK